MRFLRDVNIEFIDKRRKAFIISTSIIIMGIVSLVLHGGPNQSIDFRGGILLQLRFEKPVNASDVRESLGTIGLANARIQNFGDPREVLIQTEEISGVDVSEQIKELFQKQSGDNPFEVRREEHVGPKIGKELGVNAINAILVSLVVILAYIWWAFKKFEFGIGAIVALFHDVLITLGIFSLLDMEISLAIIAAFLTIVGYSLNDTIVVYDRIRENMKVMRDDPIDRIINKSINETLNRTVVTSLTTLLVVVILTLFGGKVIFGFALALLIGVFVGTYSSIFIASPIVVEWSNWRGLKQTKTQEQQDVPQKKKAHARYY